MIIEWKTGCYFGGQKQGAESGTKYSSSFFWARYIINVFIDLSSRTLSFAIRKWLSWSTTNSLNAEQPCCLCFWADGDLDGVRTRNLRSDSPPFYQLTYQAIFSTPYRDRTGISTLKGWRPSPFSRREHVVSPVRFGLTFSGWERVDHAIRRRGHRQGTVLFLL